MCMPKIESFGGIMLNQIFNNIFFIIQWSFSCQKWEKKGIPLGVWYFQFIQLYLCMYIERIKYRFNH